MLQNRILTIAIVKISQLSGGGDFIIKNICIFYMFGLLHSFNTHNIDRALVMDVTQWAT